MSRRQRIDFALDFYPYFLQYFKTSDRFPTIAELRQQLGGSNDTLIRLRQKALEQHAAEHKFKLTAVPEYVFVAIERLCGDFATQQLQAQAQEVAVLQQQQQEYVELIAQLETKITELEQTINYLTQRNNEQILQQNWQIKQLQQQVTDASKQYKEQIELITTLKIQTNLQEQQLQVAQNKLKARQRGKQPAYTN